MAKSVAQFGAEQAAASLVAHLRHLAKDVPLSGVWWAYDVVIQPDTTVRVKVELSGILYENCRNCAKWREGADGTLIRVRSTEEKKFHCGDCGRELA